MTPPCLASRYLRRPGVTAAYGPPRSTLYDWIAAGLLPPGVRLGPRAVGWPVDELERVFAARAAGADDAAIRRLVADLVAARAAGAVASAA